MAIAFRSVSSVGGGTRTNTTVTAPAGIQDNDILVCHMYNELGVNAITPPAGWTEWSDRTHTDTNTWYTQSFWKRASGESGNYTFTHASTWSAAVMAAYSGAETSGDPRDAAFAYNQGSSAAPVAASITNAQDNSRNIVGHTHFNTGLTLTAGSSGYTVRASVDSIALADANQASAGASGTKTFTLSLTNPWDMAHWSIKEPAAVATARLALPLRFLAGRRRPRGRA